MCAELTSDMLGNDSMARHRVLCGNPSV